MLSTWFLLSECVPNYRQLLIGPYNPHGAYSVANGIRMSHEKKSPVALI